MLSSPSLHIPPSPHYPVMQRVCESSVGTSYIISIRMYRWTVPGKPKKVIVLLKNVMQEKNRCRLKPWHVRIKYAPWYLNTQNSNIKRSYLSQSILLFSIHVEFLFHTSYHAKQQVYPVMGWEFWPKTYRKIALISGSKSNEFFLQYPTLRKLFMRQWGDMYITGRSAIDELRCFDC